MITPTGYRTRALLISIVALITFCSSRAGYGQSSADATLSGLTVGPVDVAGFSSDVTEYHVGVADSVTQVTITPTASDSGATIQIGKSLSQSNTVSSGSGHVVSLDEGLNRVYVWVTSSGGNTRKGYTLIVGRGVDDAFGWKAAEDFNTLRAAGNRRANGIWSDGTTMWVADEQDAKLYAYDMRTKARDAARDFNTLAAAGNESPEGIWSDGTTMWVADWSDRKLYAYNMSTRARDTSREVDRQTTGGGNLHPKGIWSDGTTMWVAFSFGGAGHGTLLAHTVETNSRDTAKDFNTLQAAGNEHPGGIWSDGVTMWVSDDRKLYAYSLKTKKRTAVLDYDTLKDADANITPTGIWSDGATVWVADANGKIFSFNMPPPVSYDSDSDGLIDISTLAQLNAIRWDVDGDGTVDDAGNAVAYASAFPYPAAGMGCAGTCVGYELISSLSFDETGDGRITAADGGYWNGGKGWIPIGSFNAIFRGNGHTIDNLYVNNRDEAGLFSSLSADGVITGLGVVNAGVSGSSVGGLVVRNRGTIISSYATGTVSKSGGGGSSVGGLVGSNFNGTIIASYATGSVSMTGGGGSAVGGLVGSNINGTIIASYATGSVSKSGGGGSSLGGLVGNNLNGTIVSSYWDTISSGLSTSGGGTGKSTTQLKSPTGYTGIYANWNLDLDNADGDNTPTTGGDDPWDFGTSGQYPSLNMASLRALAEIRYITLVCDRTRQVRDAILGEVPGVNNANDVTETHLSTITELILRRRNIAALKSGDFDGLNALAMLDLGHNQLSSLPADIFDDLNALTRLDLNDNQLSSLPAGIFDNLSALTFLRLDVNQLSSLPAGIFDNLNALTLLYLFDNQLSSLPVGIFDDLNALTFLHLTQNRLSSLPAGIFDNLNALTRLLLDNNSVNPLPLSLSLEKVGDGQFKAVAPSGAPFDIVLPLSIANGSINGGATTITIPAGGLESDTLSVTRTPGTTFAVNVDIGTLPELPANHSGYALVKSAGLPLEVISATTGGQASTDFNGDGKTDFVDFFLFADAYGSTNARFDLDGNGTVDFADFFKFVDAFGS